MARVGSRYVSIHTPIQGVTENVTTKRRFTYEFQSTHPYRVWLGLLVFLQIWLMFQSTHPYRVWPVPSVLHRPQISFQSTHPYRVWPNPTSFWHCPKSFNPHTHTGCDFAFRYFCHGLFGFNPHTHTGCDILLNNDIVQTNLVSIHTPIQGVTCCDIISHLVYLRFNPHTHTGCDPASLAYCCQGNVSIHTPIQGVTLFSEHSSWIGICVSIHTPIQGVTERFSDAEAKVEFQSTHPYRVWRRTTSVLDAESGFNPHTHTGCDSILKPCYELLSCFNPHTHTGCDSILKPCYELLSCFNPHTHTGCDSTPCL